MLKLVINYCLCLTLLLLFSCSGKSLESEFFKWEDFDYSKLEGYSLEDQYKIFLYGNQEIHPALTELANPIAKRGKSALDYVLEKIRESNNDLDFRDSLVIFRAMEKGGYYSVCDDSFALAEIKANENKIKKLEWQKVYHEMFERLC